MKLILKNIILFAIFGLLYFGIESIIKGQIVHYGIYFLAGTISIIIGIINEIIPWRMPFSIQCIIGALIATITECLSGAVVNLWFGMNLWHYTALPFFYNQCSLIFCGIWFFLSGVCIIANDYINWKWFKGFQPVYY